MPGGQEFTGSIGDKVHYSISRLELPWLCGPVVVVLLGRLRFYHMLQDHCHDSVNLLPHLFHVIHHRAMGCRLLLAGFLCHIQEATGLPTKEELEWCETS